MLKTKFDKWFFKKMFGASTKKEYFCSNYPSTPLNDAYYGGTSLFMIDFCCQLQQSCTLVYI